MRGAGVISRALTTRIEGRKSEVHGCFVASVLQIGCQHAVALASETLPGATSRSLLLDVEREFEASG